MNTKTTFFFRSLKFSEKKISMWGGVLEKEKEKKDDGGKKKGNAQDRI